MQYYVRITAEGSQIVVYVKCLLKGNSLYWKCIKDPVPLYSLYCNIHKLEVVLNDLQFMYLQYLSILVLMYWTAY